MIRLLADENVPRELVRALLRREPNLDIVRVQDVGLRSAPDSIILAWAAQEGRVLITYDVNTVLAAAYQRVERGEPMPGVFAIPWSGSLAPAIEDLLLLALASQAGEWEGQVLYIPF